ncbi:endonuclease [Cupriavidus necator]|uniref:hypothetical protein n=1 Tax=Cupriavidus necator TaxID=106590 RepID=UPI00073578B2|nr:hypothetical protein [Cupriavidus necator]KUE84785.1 endonuclease [Cupriavidus necator]
MEDKLSDQNAATCAICGISSQSSPLLFAHLLPTALTTKIDPKFDRVRVCKSCDMMLAIPPREAEFVAFLTYLMRETKKFSDVVQEPVLGMKTRYRADILATRKDNSKIEKLLIECKSSRFSSFNRINDVIDQLKRYKEVYGECQLVFAIPATLSDSEVMALQAEDVELWDLDFIASAFSEQLRHSPTGYFKALFLSRTQRGAKKTRERELRDALKACQPGKRDWSIYQSLVGDILEHLFCPTLSKPISEHSDSTKTNRRDFILPNYAETGFWTFLRSKYMADYLVVDAKNYSRKIKKVEVLQVANYLKPHGAGLFGAIISRNGGDAAGCAHTLREQWLIHQKMILVFDDNEIDSMLSEKEDHRAPEELIGKKIEQFRLSM